MANLFELDATINDKTMLLEQVMDAKWKWANTYSIGSASTVEEEALKLRAFMAGRHASLPVVVVNNSDYVHCTMTRSRKF